jgi:hypothetical protein
MCAEFFKSLIRVLLLDAFEESAPEGARSSE